MDSAAGPSGVFPSVVQTYSPRARAHARYRACRPAHCRQARRRPGSRAALRPIQAQTVPRGRSQALSKPHSTCALPSAGSCCPQRWHRHLPEAPAVPVRGAKGASGGRLISAFSANFGPITLPSCCTQAPSLPDGTNPIHAILASLPGPRPASCTAELALENAFAITTHGSSRNKHLHAQCNDHGLRCRYVMAAQYVERAAFLLAPQRTA